MIPTELQKEAGDLRKKMKFDDAERESKSHAQFKTYFLCGCSNIPSFSLGGK